MDSEDMRRQMDIKVRPLTRQYQKDVIDIFNYYIENSFAAYPENRVPYDFFEILLRMCDGYPAIIAEDENGNILGFGMLRAYNPLPTFSQTAEISYFLKAGLTGKGIGKTIFDSLVQEGRKKGITSILANISSLNEGSLNFHKKNGFTECGRFKNICKKNGKQFDIIYTQKIL
jgi:L-amino acid N-acyltransferase YncA